MKKMNKKILFLTMMIMTMIMVTSSTKWLAMWMGMEMNMMLTVPFMFNSKSKEMTKKIMVYFLIQTMGSIILLMFVSMKHMQMINEVNNKLITLSMMIKLGLPPFHLWMPEMMNKLDWITTTVMITIQKINPLTITMQLISQNSIITTLMVVSSLVGAISGINHPSLNKILAFSSMNHMSWILMNMAMKTMFWVKYLIMYSMITATLCIMLNKNKIFYMNQMNTNMNMTTKMMMTMMMMNLGGFPPLPGFFMKWMTLEMMTENSFYMTMIVLIIASMLTLLFYMRTMYINMLLMTSNTKFNMKTDKNYPYMVFLMNMTLPLIMYF